MLLPTLARRASPGAALPRPISLLGLPPRLPYAEPPRPRAAEAPPLALAPSTIGGLNGIGEGEQRFEQSLGLRRVGDGPVAPRRPRRTLLLRHEPRRPEAVETTVAGRLDRLVDSREELRLRASAIEEFEQQSGPYRVERSENPCRRVVHVLCRFCIVSP